MMPICHFDIPAKDSEVIKKIYGGVFGWTFDKEEDTPDSWSICFGSREQSGPMTGGIIPKSAPSQSI